MSSSYMRGAGESLESLNTQADKHRNWYDSFNSAFGKGVADINWSEREFDDNGRVKVTKYDILLGRSQPELQAGFEKWRQSQVKDTLGSKYFDTFGTDLEVDAKSDPDKINSAISQEVTRKEDVKPYLATLSATEGGAKVLAGLGDRPTVAQAQQALSGLTTTNTQTARTKAETERDEEKDWRRTVFETQQHNARESQLHRQYLAEQNAADRKANRALQREQNQQTLQLAIMDRQDRKEDRRMAREDRQADKRQQSIMMLIKGLTQLGAGFSI